jgi:hypothetical protein
MTEEKGSITPQAGINAKPIGQHALSIRDVSERRTAPTRKQKENFSTICVAHWPPAFIKLTNAAATGTNNRRHDEQFFSHSRTMLDLRIFCMENLLGAKL